MGNGLSQHLLPETGAPAGIGSAEGEDRPDGLGADRRLAKLDRGAPADAQRRKCQARPRADTRLPTGLCSKRILNLQGQTGEVNLVAGGKGE